MFLMSTLVRNEETPLNTIGSLGAVPPELKKAYISGDYAPVQKCTDPTAKDLNPIHGNIREFVEYFRSTGQIREHWSELECSCACECKFGFPYSRSSSMAPSIRKRRNH